MALWLQTTGLLARILDQYIMAAKNQRHKSASRRPSSKALWHRRIIPFLLVGKEIWASVARAFSQIRTPIKPMLVTSKSPTRMLSSSLRRIPKQIAQEWPELTKTLQVLLVEITADQSWWERPITTWPLTSNNNNSSSNKWEMTKFVYSNIRPALSRIALQGQHNRLKRNRFTCLLFRLHRAHNSSHRKRWSWQDWVNLLRMYLGTIRVTKLSSKLNQRDRLKVVVRCQKGYQLGNNRPR